MNKYIVRDVVCDWGICSVDDLGKEELVEVCNSKANAELICEILNADLMKDGKYTIWKDKKMSDLEAKLAESESELEKQKEKYDHLYGCYKKTSSEDLQDKYRLAEENAQLKHQLAEKEKEIEALKKCGDTDHFYGLLEDKKREIDICRKHIEKQDQDKISFAVEQLEKVKKWCEETRDEDEFGYLTIYADEQASAELNLLNFIDNQIKQLKEKKQYGKNKRN